MFHGCGVARLVLFAWVLLAIRAAVGLWRGVGERRRTVGLQAGSAAAVGDANHSHPPSDVPRHRGTSPNCWRLEKWEGGPGEGCGFAGGVRA